MTTTAFVAGATGYTGRAVVAELAGALVELALDPTVQDPVYDFEDLPAPRRS